jgi:hypothetical protein
MGKFFVYCGNTAVGLDPLPVIRARLTVVEPALFERDVFEMAAPIQVPPNANVWGNVYGAIAVTVASVQE